MSESPENRKIGRIFLRSWRTEEGKHKYTLQAIAEAFGYKDRRNVDNYWREFVACGEESLAFLTRNAK
ncbi:hypothetical protein WDW89_09675 [Deltaproteobacteria bacterium TL4]